MKIHAISVDEQNFKHSVTLESGETFHGIQALNQILLEPDPITKKLQPILDKYARKYLRELKAKKIESKQNDKKAK